MIRVIFSNYWIKSFEYFALMLIFRSWIMLRFIDISSSYVGSHTFWFNRYIRFHAKHEGVSCRQWYHWQVDKSPEAWHNRDGIHPLSIKTNLREFETGFTRSNIRQVQSCRIYVTKFAALSRGTVLETLPRLILSYDVTIVSAWRIFVAMIHY